MRTRTGMLAPSNGMLYHAFSPTSFDEPPHVPDATMAGIFISSIPWSQTFYSIHGDILDDVSYCRPPARPNLDAAGIRHVDRSKGPLESRTGNLLDSGAMAAPGRPSIWAVRKPGSGPMVHGHSSLLSWSVYLVTGQPRRVLACPDQACFLLLLLLGSVIDVLDEDTRSEEAVDNFETCSKGACFASWTSSPEESCSRASILHSTTSTGGPEKAASRHIP